jgi:hypothetical protein
MVNFPRAPRLLDRLFNRLGYFIKGIFRVLAREVRAI